MSKDTTTRGANGGDQGVDAIREVLLGDNLRMYEQRFELLDKTVQSEREALRDAFEQRVTQLEASFGAKIKQLETDLDTERKARADDMKHMGSRLEEASKQLDQQLQKLSSDHQSFKGESQRELLALSKNLFKELQDRCANLNAYVETESAKLDDAMAKRAQMAEALQAMALSLFPEGSPEADQSGKQ